MSQLGKPLILKSNPMTHLGIKLPSMMQPKLANAQCGRHRAHVTAASLSSVSLPRMLGNVRSAADRISPFRILQQLQQQQQKQQQDQGCKPQVDQQQQPKPVQEDGSAASWTIAAHIPLSGSTAPSPATEAAAAAVPGCASGYSILGEAGSPRIAAGSHTAANAPGSFSVSGSCSQVPDVAPCGAPSSSIWSTSSSASSSSSSLRFAKHLANVTNGCAPPSTRFESLGWLLFETKRLQAMVLVPDTTNALQPELTWTLSAGTWLQSPDKKQLLEQVYLIGQAVADLGTADGLQPQSNGSRAIASMDYAKLLARYLQQHGLLLAESFWAQLPDDELQAKAIHVAMSLETRCMVHTLLFDKLIDRVGFDGPGPYGIGSSPLPAAHSGPLATAITNTTINTSQLLNSPHTSQSVVAAPSANGNSSSVSSSSSSSAAVAGGQQGESLGSKFGAVIVLVWTLAGKVVQVLVAVVVVAKDLAMHLLMLRAMAAAAKAVTAARSPQLQAVPVAAAAAGGVAGSSPWFNRANHATAVQQRPAAAPPTPAAAATPEPKAATAAASTCSGGGISSSGSGGSSGGGAREQWAGSSTAVGSLGLLSATPLVNKPAGVGTGSVVATLAGSPPTGSHVNNVADAMPSSSSVPWQQEQQPEQQPEQQQQVVADATAEALSPAAALFRQVIAQRQLQARVQQQLDVEQQQPEVQVEQKKYLEQQRTSIGDQQQQQQKASRKHRAAAKGPLFKAGCGLLLYQLWAPEAAREGVNVV